MDTRKKGIFYVIRCKTPDRLDDWRRVGWSVPVFPVNTCQVTLSSLDGLIMPSEDKLVMVLK